MGEKPRSMLGTVFSISIRTSHGDAPLHLLHHLHRIQIHKSRKYISRQSLILPPSPQPRLFFKAYHMSGALSFSIYVKESLPVGISRSTASTLADLQGKKKCIKLWGRCGYDLISRPVIRASKRPTFAGHPSGIASRRAVTVVPDPVPSSILICYRNIR